MSTLTLDYVEQTGLHVRVGVISEQPIDLLDDDTVDALDDFARGEARLSGVPWDHNLTSDHTVEISFEDER